MSRDHAKKLWRKRGSSPAAWLFGCRLEVSHGAVACVESVSCLCTRMPLTASQGKMEAFRGQTRSGADQECAPWCCKCPSCPEEKEEAYILSAFRHNQQSTNERRVGAPQGTAAWRKAVADASIAAKAVLDGIPSTLEEAKHVEDSPPSVESLRATLQGLRAKDESTEPGAAKTTHKFGGMKHCYSDESTATALESAAVNLANAAAEAAIALEWRP